MNFRERFKLQLNVSIWSLETSLNYKVFDGGSVPLILAVQECCEVYASGKGLGRALDEEGSCGREIVYVLFASC